ncbi:MAG: hypothetical protein XXXJIFNMEKO3_00775 [Candidatus Erwinia impunctatus]|nr:hypothetical protein XXXJIFNMEKO_00775 [Culicoides impunctatus]
MWGFKHSEIIERIVSEAEEQKISKSQFIENTVTAYFKHHQNDRIKLGIGRKTQRSHRLQVVFKNEELVALIKNHSKKYAISKSKIIEFILGQYLDVKNNEIENNNKTRQNFSSNIFIHTILTEDKLNNRRYKKLNFDIREIDLEIKSRSLSLSILNKSYLNEIKNRLIFNPDLNSEKTRTDNFCYVI